jgi:hypothetical protein
MNLISGLVSTCRTGDCALRGIQEIPAVFCARTGVPTQVASYFTELKGPQLNRRRPQRNSLAILRTDRGLLLLRAAGDYQPFAGPELIIDLGDRQGPGSLGYLI